MAMFSVIHMNEFQILNRISITYNLYQNDFFLRVYLGLKFWENYNQSSAVIFNRNTKARWVNLLKLKYPGDCFFENVRIFSSWGRALKLTKKTSFLANLQNSTQL